MARPGVGLLAALAPAALLAVDPFGWYPFGPIKWLLVLTLSLGGSAMVLRDRSPRLSRPVRIAGGAFLGWLLLATAVGADPLYAWTGTPERHFGALTWGICALLFVVGTAFDGRDGQVLVDGLLVAGLGVGAVAGAEALGWEPSVLDVAGRLSGPVGSPAYLGAATALLLPVAVAVATGGGPRPVAPAQGMGIAARWPSRQAAGAVASVLLSVACLGSGARAAWVGLLAAGVVAAAAGAGRLRHAVRSRPRRAVACAAMALVAGVLVIACSPVGSRITDATDPTSAGGRGRLDEWRIAARVVAGHPVVGVGPEGYRTAFAGEVDARYERQHGRRQQPDRAHSGPLDLAVTGGVPLLAAWLAIVAIVARSVWRALRGGRAWQQGIAAGLVAHQVGQLLLFPIVELEPVAWLLAGVVVVTAPTRPARPSAPPEQEDTKERRVRGVGAGVLGVLAALGLVNGLTDMAADHRAERAADALAHGDARSAVREADSAAALRPDIVRLHLLAARAAVADQQGALGGLRRVADALAVSPQDPIALLERTSLLVQRAEATQTGAHVTEARAAVDERLRRDPNAAALWRLSARLAVVEGNADRAGRDADRAAHLTPPDERR